MSLNNTNTLIASTTVVALGLCAGLYVNGFDFFEMLSDKSYTKNINKNLAIIFIVTKKDGDIQHISSIYVVKNADNFQVFSGTKHETNFISYIGDKKNISSCYNIKEENIHKCSFDKVDSKTTDCIKFCIESEKNKQPISNFAEFTVGPVCETLYISEFDNRSQYKIENGKIHVKY